MSNIEAAEFPGETKYGVLTRVDGAAHMRRGADVRQISGVTPCSRITLVFRWQTFVSPTLGSVGGKVTEEPRRRQNNVRVFSCSWPILPSGFGAGHCKRWPFSILLSSEADCSAVRETAPPYFRSLFLGQHWTEGCAS